MSRICCQWWTLSWKGFDSYWSLADCKSMLMLGTKTIAFDTNFFGLLILCFFYNWKQFWEVGVGIYLEQKSDFWGGVLLVFSLSPTWTTFLKLVLYLRLTISYPDQRRTKDLHHTEELSLHRMDPRLLVCLHAWRRSNRCMQRNAEFRRKLIWPTDYRDRASYTELHSTRGPVEYHGTKRNLG